MTIVDGIKIWVNSSGQVYIPPHDTELQLCIFVAAHSGLEGHRGREETKSLIFEKVHWPNLEADVDEFCQDCFFVSSSLQDTKCPIH